MFRANFLWVLVAVVLVVACQSKVIDPYALEVQELDQQRTRYELAPEQMRYVRRLMVMSFSDPQGSATPEQLEAIRKSLLAFRLDSGFVLLTTPPRDADADYVQAQVSLAIEPPKEGAVSQRFTADVGLHLSNPKEGTDIFRQTLRFDSGDYSDFRRSISALARYHFPRLGYVLETRGERSVVRISLGKRSRLQKGAAVAFYTMPQRLDRLVPAYQSLPIKAQGKLILVFAESAWVQIESKGKEPPAVLLGDFVVYDSPPKKPLQ